MMDTELPGMHDGYVDSDGLTWKDMGDVCNFRSLADGRSTVDALCPWCNTWTTCALWSLSGSGKLCRCGALLTRTHSREPKRTHYCRARVEGKYDWGHCNRKVKRAGTRCWQHEGRTR